MSGEDREFLRKKIRHFLSILDCDKDGAVSMKDHEVLAERAIRVTGTDPQSLQAKQIRSKMIKTFEQIYAPLNNGQPVPYDKLILFLEKDPDEYRRIINQNKLAFFDMIDLNGDGMIQLSEFKVFYQIFGLNPDEADGVFRMIDLNKNGVLERHEFMTFIGDYFFKYDKESVSKHFFGIFSE